MLRCVASLKASMKKRDEENQRDRDEDDIEDFGGSYRNGDSGR